jgi:NosR/NirI family nitrous oxide reductase transcriptional regulator
LDLYPETRDALCDDCSNTTEIWTAYLNVPTIGRAILGDEDYQRLRQELKAGEHVVGIMARGFYPIPAPTFRDGTVPERIALEQNGLSIPLRNLSFWRDKPWNRPEAIATDLQLRLFKIRPQVGFNPAAPFKITVHFNLARNHLVRDTGSIGAEHSLPEWLFMRQVVEQRKAPPPLWLTLWQGRLLEIGILLTGLAFLTLLFLKQSYFIRPGAGLKHWRYGFLFFTVGFIGYFAQGQLSVVNIYTLLLELFDGFNIDVFLLDPILFILWTYTFVTLFLFGRGLFCGWLCPFGALQEFAADFGKWLRIPQLKVPDRIDRPLRMMKYLTLLLLVGVSFVSLSTAEMLAEVEPFKTAITLSFLRSWPFVLYAVGLLALSMLIHKFYCRYVCPLGAGLALLGAFPVFKWLHRRTECGDPCQLCRHKCEIGAIDRSGHIDYLECIQCLECVRIIEDPSECAPARVAQKRKLKTSHSLGPNATRRSNQSENTEAAPVIVIDATLSKTPSTSDNG